MSNSEPTTKDEAVSQVHSALDTVESAFKTAFGQLSDKVQTLLAHLHHQADGVVSDVKTDLDEDVAEVKQDVTDASKAYDAVPIDGATGAGPTGGGTNPNAASVTPDNPTGQP